MKTYTGAEYLAIDLANHYGLDKLLFEERIQWVKDNFHHLLDLVDEADEPELYYKAVLNFYKAAKGEATGHMVALDAICSGIQIMSCLTGCRKGATATGLLKSDIRPDAYTSVLDAMNNILNQDNKKNIQLARKDIKRAVMTSCYGSKKVPTELFGEGYLLQVFRQATEEVAYGAFKLLDILRDTWKPSALSHSWTLPDLHYVDIKVMQLQEKRLEIDELGHYKMSVQYYENIGQEKGVSNVANIVHSIDAYILRQMIRRCNYDYYQVKIAQQIIRNYLDNPEPQEPQDTLFNQHVAKQIKANFIDPVVLQYLNENNVCEAPVEYLERLLGLLDWMSEHPPFEISPVHDAFMCLPNNCNRLRACYIKLMSELAASKTLDCILSDLYGEETEFEKLADISQEILNSEYAIC